MARTDAMVLGAGIVGTSVALHLAKRGLSVALVDRAGIGEQTSYGNAGIIEGNTIFPPAFPSSVSALLRIAFKRASEANYHVSFLPQIAPWLLAFRAASRPEKLAETAQLIRPLFSRAVAEHEALLAEAAQRNICVRPAGSRFTAPKRVSSRSRPSSTWRPSSGCRCNHSIRPGHWHSNRLSIRYSRTGCSGRRLRASATRSA